MRYQAVMMSQPSSSNLARNLCNKRIVKHFLWYKVGIASSARLRGMQSGSSLLTNLDKLYAHICHQQRHRIQKLGSRLDYIGSNIAGFQWICETVLSGCQTEQQLVTFAVMFLVLIVGMLERTEQSHLDDTADRISSILCDSMSNNIKFRERKNVFKGLAMSFLTIGVCLSVHSLWNIA